MVDIKSDAALSDNREAEHTPTPYYATGVHVQSAAINEDNYVCKCDTEVDALNIVTACNSHAQLVAALEGLLNATSTMNAAMDDGANIHGAVSGLIGAEDNARTALASVENGGE